MPDVYTRLHAAGMTDTMGAGLLILGMLLQTVEGILHGQSTWWFVLVRLILDLRSSSSSRARSPRTRWRGLASVGGGLTPWTAHRGRRGLMVMMVEVVDVAVLLILLCRHRRWRSSGSRNLFAAVMMAGIYSAPVGRSLRRHGCGGRGVHRGRGRGGDLHGPPARHALDLVGLRGEEAAARCQTDPAAHPGD